MPTCDYCNKEFEPRRSWQRFCNKEHQRLYWIEVRKAAVEIAAKRIGAVTLTRTSQ